FFFQAEDGIRDRNVTGVQTCALPILDIDASFEEKAYKYGVLDVDNGYELAWGISEYGPQEYNLSYSLSNMVRELEDGQALFWNRSEERRVGKECSYR